MLAGVVGLAGAVLGCGDGAGSGAFDVGGVTSCGLVDPCGGDLVGTWSFTTGCITSTGIQDFESGGICAGESIAVTGIDTSGTARFNSDLTYSFSMISQQRMCQVAIPQSCVQGICSDAATRLETSGMFESASCVGSSTSCICTGLQPRFTDTENGTYTLTGNFLTTVSTTGSTSTLSYCVQGSYLHLIATSPMSRDSTGGPAVDEDMVGAKQ